MPKQTPSPARLFVMTAFALSCFGLLLFLWLAFGGTVPLKPKGYQVDVPFREATQLADQADVRISGVPVGKVVKLRRDGGLTVATLELESKYAPLPSDALAQLRTKTLLGETYVELTPGSRTAPKLREGGTLALGRVKDTVQLDEILRSLDAPTRGALQTWFQGWSKSVDGRAESISSVTAGLPGLAQDGNDVTRTLDAQGRSLSALVRDTGTVLGTVGDRDNAVQELVTSGRTVFQATAARDTQLAATIHELPGFLSSLREALPPLRDTARVLTPALDDLDPAVRQLPATLTAAQRFSPVLADTASDLDGVLPLLDSGLPAIERVLKALPPLADDVNPLTRQLEPIVSFLRANRVSVTNSWPKVAAATQAKTTGGGNTQAHYLRLVAPLSPETLAIAQQRQPASRTNPYLAPDGIRGFFSGGLKAYTCANTKNPEAGIPTGLLGAPPPCQEQGPYPFAGGRTAYPTLTPAPVVK